MILKHSYDRILEISDDHKQITMPDSRYYRRNGEYYPSITYVLQYYPKDKHFENWLKQVGKLQLLPKLFKPNLLYMFILIII